MDNDSPFQPTVLGAMWRYRWLVLLVILLVTGVAIAYALSRPVRHEAVATIVVQEPRVASVFDLGQAERPDRYVANQATILESTVVAERALERLAADGRNAAAFETMSVDVLWSTNRDDIRVVVAVDDADLAVDGANALVDAYSEIRQETVAASFAAALDELDDSSAKMEARLRALQGAIDAVVERNPASAELRAQYESALRRLADLQEELPDVTDEDDLEELRAQLDDVRQQLLTMQVVNSLESGQRELVTLLDEEEFVVVRRNELARRADELAVEARLEGTGIVLSSPAVGAVEVGANVPRTAAVGLVLGGLAAAGLAYALAIRRRKFTDSDQPESVLRARLVAEVPDFRREKVRGDLPVLTHPASAAAEAFRFVAGSMRMEASAAETANRIFVVVSGAVGDGKTVVAANAALAAASKGGRVLAIDADFGNQRLSSLLSAGEREIALSAPERGLTDLDDDDDGASLANVVRRVTVTEGVEVELLSKGSAEVSAPEFFAGDHIGQLFEALRGAYDLVIIDTPPLTKVAYASEVTRHADRALVVVPHRGSVTPVEDVSERLAIVGVQAVGYVYNKAPLTDDMARYDSSLKHVFAGPDDR